MMGISSMGRLQHLLKVLLQMSLVVLMNCQSNIVVKRVVEGHSTNVVIVCDLPLSDMNIPYWNISGQIYIIGNVPDVFDISRDNGDLIIPQVKGAMEGFRFQCFTFRVNGNGLNLGQTTVLNVIRVHAPSQNKHDLLQPSMKREVLFHYQFTRINFSTITLAWLYYPTERSPTCGMQYKVTFYTENNIARASSQNELVPHNISYITRTETLQVPYYSSDDYANIEAMDTANVSCARTGYLLNITHQESVGTTQINSFGSSAQFQIPHFLSDGSLHQLVWLKNDSVQCACPPVEDIARCACNKINYNNTINIDNDLVNITNLTGDLMLYFIASSHGCHGNCNVGSIARIYSINMAFQEHPAVTASTPQCEKYQVQLASSSTSVDIELTCLTQQHSTLDLSISHGSTIQMVTIACNSTVNKGTLQPETEYMISYNICLLRTFRTGSFAESFNDVLHGFIAIGAIPEVVIAVLIIIILLIKYRGLVCTCYPCYRSHAPMNKDKTDEMYQTV